LDVMLSESEASAFPTGYEKADSSAVPQNDFPRQSPTGEDKGERAKIGPPHSNSLPRGERESFSNSKFIL
jgi:hypothetical protein